MRVQFAWHLLRIGAIVWLLTAAMVWPFLPGEYDALAPTLSTAAQLVGSVGMLLVPVGVLWLALDVRAEPNRARTGWRYGLALAALGLSGVVVLAVVLAAVGQERLSFGLLTLALWLYALYRLVPAVRRLRQAPTCRFVATPLYLIVIPPALLILQLLLGPPLAELSRRRAMAAGAVLIQAIEAYRTAHGEYPATLVAVHKDYQPSVIGIDRYHYSRRGETYNLSFEQPLFLLDDIGAREFVVYNPRDEHFILSHASWHLVWTPDVAATRQGWFAAFATAAPHWKVFRFD